MQRISFSKSTGSTSSPKCAAAVPFHSSRSRSARSALSMAEAREGPSCGRSDIGHLPRETVELVGHRAHLLVANRVRAEAPAANVAVDRRGPILRRLADQGTRCAFGETLRCVRLRLLAARMEGPRG